MIFQFLLILKGFVLGFSMQTPLKWWDELNSTAVCLLLLPTPHKWWDEVTKQCMQCAYCCCQLYWNDETKWLNSACSAPIVVANSTEMMRRSDWTVHAVRLLLLPTPLNLQWRQIILKSLTLAQKYMHVKLCSLKLCKHLITCHHYHVKWTLVLKSRVSYKYCLINFNMMHNSKLSVTCGVTAVKAKSAH